MLVGLKRFYVSRFWGYVVSSDSLKMHVSLIQSHDSSLSAILELLKNISFSLLFKN